MPGRRYLLRAGLRILVVRVGLRQAAPRLLDELVRGGFIGGGSSQGRGTGLSRGQCLIVDLVRYFFLVDQ